jgi:hypothetical protein
VQDKDELRFRADAHEYVGRATFGSGLQSLSTTSSGTPAPETAAWLKKRVAHSTHGTAQQVWGQPDQGTGSGAVGPSTTNHLTGKSSNLFLASLWRSKKGPGYCREPRPRQPCSDEGASNCKCLLLTQSGRSRVQFTAKKRPRFIRGVRYQRGRHAAHSVVQSIFSVTPGRLVRRLLGSRQKPARRKKERSPSEQPPN